MSGGAAGTPARWRRHVLVAGLVAVATAGCMNPVAEEPLEPVARSSGTPAPTPTPTVCPESGVRVAAGVVDAAMGTRAVPLRLVNCGTKPVTVNGYPGLLLRDEDGQPLKVTVRNGTGSAVPDPGPKAVALRPGQVAQAVLSWRNTVTIGSPALAGATIEVTPSPGITAQQVRVMVDVGNTGVVALTAWHRAANR